MKALLSFISSFHFIIEDLFKNEYPLLWSHIKIRTYWKYIDDFNEIQETNHNGKYLLSNNNELIPEETFVIGELVDLDRSR